MTAFFSLSYRRLIEETPNATGRKSVLLYCLPFKVDSGDLLNEGFLFGGRHDPHPCGVPKHPESGLEQCQAYLDDQAHRECHEPCLWGQGDTGTGRGIHGWVGPGYWYPPELKKMMEYHRVLVPLARCIIKFHRTTYQFQRARPGASWQFHFQQIPFWLL